MEVRWLGNKSILVCLLCAVAALGAGKKKKLPEPHALIAGTVFRDPGFSLPGAEVSVWLSTEQDQPKIKKLTAISDARGEFAFRVSTVAATYTVRVACKGYSPQQKQVPVEGEQRVDATFTLSPESK